MTTLYDKLSKRSKPLGRTCDQHPGTELNGFLNDLWCPRCDAESLLAKPKFYACLYDIEYDRIKEGATLIAFMTPAADYTEAVLTTQMGIHQGEKAYIVEVLPSYYPFDILTDSDGSFDAPVCFASHHKVDRNKPPVFIVNKITNIVVG